jgi:hypothetical protein
MKYFFSLSMVLSWSVLFAQNSPQYYMALGNTAPHTGFIKPSKSNTASKSILWNETFDIGTTGPAATAGPTFTTSNGTWTAIGVDSLAWKHSFLESNGEYSFDIAPFTSNSPTDGFMLFDADSINMPSAPNYDLLTAELISPVIDLTGQASAMLELQQDFRFCCNNTHDITVSISSDGGVTWGAPYDLSEGMIPTMSYQQWNYGNFKKRIDITSQAAGNTILLKFAWDGNSSGNTHYYWSLDDVCISTMPTDDIDILTSTFSGNNNRGVQYGRTWQAQVNQNYNVGVDVLNFGTNDQTNVSLNAGFTSFSSATSSPLLGSGSTTYLGQLESLSLPLGLYSGTYTAISDGDSIPNPGDNEFTREFEITPNPTPGGVSQCSLDGIGVYTSPVISSIGTDSFGGTNDGMILGSLYYIQAPQEYIAMRIMLAPGTVPGGDVYASIKDSSAFWNDPFSIVAANSQTITNANVVEGYMNICFEPFTLAPGAYYAAIELYSNGGANPIRVLDDMTITQPSFASGMYIYGDTTYSNGNAIAIRLIDESYYCTGNVNENMLDQVVVVPNPTFGLVNLIHLGATKNLIEVIDLLGNRLLTKSVYADCSLDLSEFSSGVYVINISNGTNSISRLVMVE